MFGLCPKTIVFEILCDTIIFTSGIKETYAAFVHGKEAAHVSLP